MRGKFIPADECLRLGVATEVVPHEGASPDGGALCAGNPRSRAHGCLRHQGGGAPGRGPGLSGQGLHVARDVADRILHTEDSKEGILAFREKRKPEWRGR